MVSQDSNNIEFELQLAKSFHFGDDSCCGRDWIACDCGCRRRRSMVTATIHCALSGVCGTSRRKGRSRGSLLSAFPSRLVSSPGITRAARRCVGECRVFGVGAGGVSWAERRCRSCGRSLSAPRSKPRGRPRRQQLHRVPIPQLAV